MSDELFNQIMGAAYDFRDAHLSGSMNLKRSAHTSLAEVVRAALAAAPSQERIDALELEVRQLTEKVAALRHALRSQQLAPSAAPAEQQMVAYLDIGAGGYIDLGSELPDETLLRLPKGRHALVIAGTFGIDGYVAAAPKPAPSAAPAEADGWCAHYLPCECAPEAREGCVSWRKRKPSPTPQADSTQSPAPEVGRVYLVATGESHEGEETYTRHDNAPPPLCDSECLYTTPQADSQPAPVLWVSPEQFANLVDGDKAPFGTYLPVRKTSAGKFTMPLFTASAPADSVLKDHQIAALVNELRDIAIEFHGAQQLRERIAQVVVPALKAKSADSVLEDAARLERERICAAIKAEDDYCVENGDYMLDSNDCINIVRAKWVRPDYLADAARKQGANHD